jgi:hypothetical protein
MLFDRIFILSLQNIVALKYIKLVNDDVFNRTEMKYIHVTRKQMRDVDQPFLHQNVLHP